MVLSSNFPRIPVVAGALLLSGCSLFAKDNHDKSGAVGKKESPAYVTVEMSIANAAAASLALAPANVGFTGHVANCASGYAATFDQSAASIKILRGDSGCAIALDSLTLDGETYSLDSAAWAAGAQFFSPSASGQELRISVAANIESGPVTANQTFKMTYARSEIGAQKVVTRKSNIVVGIDVSEGEPLGMDLVGFDVAVDSSMTIQLACDQVMSGTSCHGQDVTQHELAVVKESSYPTGLTIAMCDQVAAGGLKGAALDVGSEEAAYGGLSFGPYVFGISLDVNAEEKLLAVVRSASGSCKVFPVTIAPVQ